MTDRKELAPKPYMVHLPDSYTPEEAAQGASWQLGAGFYEIGVEVDGARFPLARLHGGAVEKQFALVQAAKAEKSADDSPE